MRMHWKWKAVKVLAAMGLGLLACACGSTATENPTLALTLGHDQLGNQGQTTDVRVTAVSADAQPGTGSVVITSTAGQLGSGGTSVTLTLSGGMASTTFACPVAQDAKCAGRVLVEARWNDVQSTSGTNVVAN